MSVEESFAKGIKCAKAGRYTEAGNFFLEVLKTTGISERRKLYQKALYNYGIICLKLGKYEEAIEKFNVLTLIDPNDTDSWYGLGIAGAL